MNKTRNEPAGRDPSGSALDASAERTLTARSVLASTLLGTRPPRLPVSRLVRAGALFGIPQGTVRTALSRMVAAGELEADNGWYRLSGRLLERARRQDDSRAADTLPWRGDWSVAVVPGGRRSAVQRAELRGAALELRYGELRDGVWVRPANLDPARLPQASGLLERECQRFDARPVDHLDPALIWDLDDWAGRATQLEQRLGELVGRLDDGDTEALAPGFVLSAAVLRHFQADPLLPAELLPAGWPGPVLRQRYDRYDAAYRGLLRSWFDRSDEPAPTGRGEDDG
jgi:phenylacetic acid degradation operon negative regulatory protein